MIQITQNISISESEFEISAIRASGPGGQHVNKVSTAIFLKFDIKASSLPDFYKIRLLGKRDRRITKDGSIVIKSQAFKSQLLNKTAAIDSLVAMIQSATHVPKSRRATRPTKSSKLKRLQKKKQKSMQKKLRQNKDYYD